MPVINLHACFEKSYRKDKQGNVKSSHYVVNYRADNLYVNSDSKAAVTAMAKAALVGIKKDFEKMPDAKPSTIARREQTLRSWEKGHISPSMLKKFSGGRIGLMPPKPSTKLFRESGRLIEGMTLNPRTTSKGESVLTMNVAANRFDPSTFGGGEAGLEERVFNQLRQHHPFFGANIGGQANEQIDKALKEVHDKMYTGSKSEAIAALQKFGQAAFDIAVAVANLSKGI